MQFLTRFSIKTLLTNDLGKNIFSNSPFFSSRPNYSFICFVSFAFKDIDCWEMGILKGDCLGIS